MLVTHPDSRRRGLGRALLLTALHRLRDRGAETATLFTESTNTSARQLYGALGFTISDESIQHARVIEP
jgi:ribosomal protein S18 acetylase RimI-like enzyme